MSFLELSLIAIALSMDSFAVSLTNGSSQYISYKKGLKIALIFALIQSIMLISGWLPGIAFKDMMKQIDHWIVFSLMFIIGLKMIVEAIKFKPEERQFNINKNYVLIMLAIATGINTFVTGISFGFLDVSIIKASIIIGIITFIFSYSGICLGKINRFIKPRTAELFGGLVMIVIGLKILTEHIYLK